MHQILPNEGDRRKQISDHRGPPEAHLPPRQNIAHKSSCHHEEEDNDAQNPQKLPRLLERAIIETPKHVNVDDQKKHGGTVHVEITDEPPSVHIPHDAFHTVEGHIHMGRIGHR